MIVIGADVHMRSHTFVAVDDGSRKLESIGPTYNDRRSQTLRGSSLSLLAPQGAEGVAAFGEGEQQAVAAFGQGEQQAVAAFGQGEQRGSLISDRKSRGGR
ncbi:hypothetical protein M1C59_01400 [Gordonia terrae]|uniref:hypothetical protein n=1 Tax=Gordonia terrae TaxID=2055 RepID=UPI00200B4006|nr:hypothetical protein [Gordonia terrae]UPW09554.1 hypothetical protein M1C59_01400 [Gordonia terrae]